MPDLTRARPRRAVTIPEEIIDHAILAFFNGRENATRRQGRPAMRFTSLEHIGPMMVEPTRPGIREAITVALEDIFPADTREALIGLLQAHPHEMGVLGPRLAARLAGLRPEESWPDPTEVTNSEASSLSLSDRLDALPEFELEALSTPDRYFVAIWVGSGPRRVRTYGRGSGGTFGDALQGALDVVEDDQ